MFAVEDRGSTLHAPPRLVGTQGDRPVAADGGALVSRLPLDESPSRRPGPAGLPADTAQPRPREVLPRSRPSGSSRSAVRLHHPACSAGAVERNRTASEATSRRHHRVRIRTFSAVTSRSPPRDLCGGQWTLLLGEPRGRAARCPPAYPWRPANRLVFRRMSRCPFPVRTPSRPWIRSARGRCPGRAGDSPWCMCSPPLVAPLRPGEAPSSVRLPPGVYEQSGERTPDRQSRSGIGYPRRSDPLQKRGRVHVMQHLV